MGSLAPNNDRTKRPMVRTQLLGQHTHSTTANVDVHVWLRGGKYVARGRLAGNAFGETLGEDPSEASRRLRHILVEIENGTFLRSSERPQRQLKLGAPPKLDVRRLIDAYLVEKRRLVGKETTQDYKSRLERLIQFSESPPNRRRWPHAGDIDHQFALAFRSWLFAVSVSRNGHPSALAGSMSLRQIYNVMDSVRSMLNWAARPSVNLLVSWFNNPFTSEVVGQRQVKDPLRSAAFTLEERGMMIRHMDAWQLLHLSWRLVLPLRPEDFSGLLIADINFQQRRFLFGSRFSGGDHNKGRLSFYCPFPAELDGLLQCCIGNREAGPMLRRREVFTGAREATLQISAIGDESKYITEALANTKAGELQTWQDHKRVIRKCLRDMGGLYEDGQRRELRKALESAGLNAGQNTYEFRRAINTEMDTAGVSLLVQRYVTGHRTDDIQNHYVSLQPDEQMRRYFDYIAPLLDTIQRKGSELGLKI